MKRLTTSNLIVWAIGLVFFFMLLAYLVPTMLLIDFLNGIFLGIVAAVFAVYMPMVWQTLGQTRFDRAGQLSIGIALLWLSIAMSRGWSAWYRYIGSPIDLLNSPVIAFFIYIACIAGALFVTAPGYYPPPPVPVGGRNRYLLLGFALIGGSLAVFFHYN